MNANTFQFWTQWDEDGKPFGQLHHYNDLPAARRAHDHACRGMWIQRGMTRPHVSALKVCKEGYVLWEELQEKRDLPEFGRASTEKAAA